MVTELAEQWIHYGSMSASKMRSSEANGGVSQYTPAYAVTPSDLLLLFRRRQFLKMPCIELHTIRMTVGMVDDFMTFVDNLSMHSGITLNPSTYAGKCRGYAMFGEDL